MQTLESLGVRVTRPLLAIAVGAWLLLTGCSSDSNSPGAASTAGASSSAPVRSFRILVSNDDGVAAPGIDALVRALTVEPATEVTVVAPATNQSGSGGKTTTGMLTATQATTASGYPATAVQGFPADSVDYGLSTVVTSPPDLVMSGVNAGQNLGPVVDVSGTVGAARAAAQHGIPALAVSAGLGDPIDFKSAADAAVSWLHDHRDELVSSHAPPTSVSNLNVPTCVSGSVRGQVTVPADATAPTDAAVAPADCTSTAAAGSTDVAAFHAGFATLSDVPIRTAGS
jgi:5'-nucleotidase